MIWMDRQQTIRAKVTSVMKGLLVFKLWKRSAVERTLMILCRCVTTWALKRTRITETNRRTRPTSTCWSALSPAPSRVWSQNQLWWSPACTRSVPTLRITVHNCSSNQFCDVCLSVCIDVRQSVCLSVCMNVGSSVCLSVWRYACLYVGILVCLGTDIRTDRQKDKRTNCQHTDLPHSIRKQLWILACDDRTLHHFRRFTFRCTLTFPLLNEC